MAVYTANDRRAFKFSSPIAKRLRLDRILANFDSTTGELALTPDITGTDSTIYTINAEGSDAKLAFDTASATGDFTLTVSNQNIAGDEALTWPTGHGASKYIAVSSSADGSVTTTASTGTTNTTFLINPTGTATTLTLSAAASGTSGKGLTLIPHATMADNYTVTFPDPGGADEVVYTDLTQTLANKTLTTPTISATGFTNAQHDHSGATSGGSISASGSMTSTTSSTWSLLPAADEGDLVLSVTGGGSDNSVTITNTQTSGSDRIWTLPDATDTFVGVGATQTLTAKTLTAPVINALTITGAVTITTPSVTGTWTNLGAVTTVDINGGTIDATPIGGSTAAAGAFTTIAAANHVTIAAGYDLILAKGAGEIAIAAASNGGITIKPTASTTSILTISSIAQTQATTISYPDVNAATDTLATLGLANVFTGANTFASATGNDAAFSISGTPGSGGAGGTVVVAGGGGDTGTAGGLVSLTGGLGNTTGAGGAASLVGGQSGNGAGANGGAVVVTGGAGAGSGATDGGAVTITSGVSGGASGTAGALSIDTGSKTGGTAGAMTIAGTNTTALGIGNASCTITVTGALAMAEDDNITLTSTGTNGYISLNGSVSGGIKLLPLATGTALTTITNQNVAAATITLPDATTTLLGHDTTQVVTNKTIDGDSNTVLDLPWTSPKGGAVANDAAVGIPVILKFTITSGDATDSYTVDNGTYDLEILDSWVIKVTTSADGGDSVQIKNDATAVTDDLALNITDHTRAAFSTFDDSQTTVADGSVLNVVGTNSTNCGCLVYVLGMWV